jgi:hypothetical protein
MKRPVILFFTFVYLVVASGLSVNLHYCGGKIKDVSLFYTGTKDDSGCCGKMKKSKGCCNNKSAILKVNDDQQYVSIVKYSPEQLLSDYLVHSSVLSFLINQKFELIETVQHPPPLLSSSPIYICNRVLII